MERLPPQRARGSLCRLSPIVTVDADKILGDLPGAHVLHIVRNPWSAYADTKKRPVPLSLAHYMLGWTLNQYYALQFREKYPDRMHVIRIERRALRTRRAIARLDARSCLRR